MVSPPQHWWNPNTEMCSWYYTKMKRSKWENAFQYSTYVRFIVQQVILRNKLMGLVWTNCQSQTLKSLQHDDLKSKVPSQQINYCSRVKRLQQNCTVRAVFWKFMYTMKAMEIPLHGWGIYILTVRHFTCRPRNKSSPSSLQQSLP